MTGHYKFVYDWNEVENFYNMLPQLKNDEVFFVSLSCRNKYLTKEERERIGLSKTEMFAKSIIRRSEWTKFKSVISRFECNKDSYITKTGCHYPEKATICYFSINPKSQYRGYTNFVTKMNRVITEHTMYMMNNTSGGHDLTALNNKLRRLEVEYMNSLVQSDAYKYFIDVDFDIDKSNPELYDEYIEYLKEVGINHFTIETKSGFHVLMVRDSINKDTQKKDNFFLRLKDLNRRAKEMNPKFEIIKNDNGMVSLPGTYQGGHMVKIVQKWITK